MNKIYKFLLIPTIGVIAGIGYHSNHIVKPISKNVMLLAQHQNSAEKLSGNSAINYIQNHYLMQNLNGTLYIKNTAIENIDSNTLNILNNHLATLNKEILAGDIKFKVERKNNIVTVQAYDANKSLLTRKVELYNKSMSNSLKSKSSELFDLPARFIVDGYIDNITYTWYGAYGNCRQEYLPWLYDNLKNSPFPSQAWLSTIWTAERNGYTITVTWLGGVNGGHVTNISY